jgi:hypothetical protein
MIRQGAAFITNGEYFTWDGTNLHWKGLVFIFDDSTAVFNEVANQLTDSPGLTDLANGECIYVDLDRSQNRTIAGTNPLIAVKTTLSLLGQGIPPGSRWVLAWRYGSAVFTRDQSFPVNSSQIVATVSSTGNVQLSASEPTFPANPRVALVDAIATVAIAGGLTRGDAGGLGVDFFGGSGDLVIGGFSHDFNIFLRTTRTQDSVIITGAERWTTSANATVEILNSDDMIAHPGNLLAKFKGWNGIAGQFETGINIQSLGVVSFRNVPVTPSTPAPTLLDPIRSNMFFRNNGELTGQIPPISRDQLCVMYWDGTIVVISESNPY